MKKLILMLTLALMVAEFCTAQEPKNVVLISLKNGSFLRGYVIPESDIRHITVNMSDDDSVRIPYGQIQSIKYSFGHEPHEYNKVRRFYNVTEIGIMFGKTGSESSLSSTMTAQNTLGYEFFRLFKIGLGVSYDQYDNVYTAPIFINIRGDMMKKKITPFYSVNTGYGAAWGDSDNWLSKVEGGKMFDFGLGLSLSSIEDYRLILSLGYKIQNLVYETEDWQGNLASRTERTNRRFRFTIGIGF